MKRKITVHHVDHCSLIDTMRKQSGVDLSRDQQGGLVLHLIRLEPQRGKRYGDLLGNSSPGTGLAEVLFELDLG